MTQAKQKNFDEAIRLTKVALSSFGVAVAYLMIIAMDNILYEGRLSWRFMVYCSLSGAPFIITAGIFCQWFVKYCTRQGWNDSHERLVFLLQLIVSVAIGVGFAMIGFAVFDPIQHASFSAQASELYYKVSMIAVALLAILILIISKYVDQVDYSRLKERELEENKLRLTEMHYKQLKAQVNPHFLFNSLNVLVSLISIDQNRAVKYTTELASIYRYLLSHDDRAMSSLREELDFATQYSNIMQMRFSEGLNITLPRLTDPTVGNLYVIPASVQVLIENACKHNLLSKESPLNVEVYIDEGSVVVTNNVSLRSQPSDSTGLGLSGLISKYELVTRRRVEVEQTAERFTVRVPLLTADECRNLFVKPNQI